MAAACRFVLPWWDPASDARPFGEPETTVELPGEITHGLLIRSPFGIDTDAMVTIHAWRTGTITMAIGDVVAINTRERLPACVLQSGRNRSARTQADGFSEEEGDAG